MPLIENDTVYQSCEFFGKTNTGKTYVAYSILELFKRDDNKNKVIMFTNESNWSESKDEWKEYKDDIIVYFHRNLDEFKSDIEEFKKRFGIKQVVNPKTEFKVWRTKRVDDEILAVIIDEAVFIYREGWIELEREKLAKRNIDMLPKHYGTPRRNFMNQVKFLAGLPCHFFLLSKVGKEYEEVYKYSADGKKKWLTFEATGEDAYRLPDDQEYEPSIRGHLFAQDKRADKQDKTGENILKKDYYVRLVKQKADRTLEPLIELPTMRKILVRLNQIRIVKSKKGK